MKSIILKSLIISIAISVSFGSLLAQSSKSRISMSYVKKQDNVQSLEITLLVKFDRYTAMSDAIIKVYNVVDTSKTYLGEYVTDENGKAHYIIDEASGAVKDSSGLYNFLAVYDGNDSIKSSESDLTVKEGKLDISFAQKDSVKSISIVASEIDSRGNSIPLEGMEIKFYVKGTFSLYKFADGETDDHGLVTVKFPVDMPGDTAGVLSIVAKIEENDDFGTVETLGQINWGTPIQPVTEKNRGLGDTDAPLWMVYTLIFLLSAVWLHYLYVIFLIVKIKITK